MNGKWHEHTITPTDAPTPCGGACSAVIRNTIDSFGGVNSRQYSDELFKLDLSGKRWKWIKVGEIGIKPERRRGAGMCQVNKKLLLMGGDGPFTNKKHPHAQYNEGGTTGFGWDNEFFEFEPHTDCWSVLSITGSKPSPRYNHTMTAFEEWTEIRPSLLLWPQLRSQHTVCTMVCDNQEIKLLLMGGFNGKALDDCWLLDVHQGIGEKVTFYGRPFMSRYGHSAHCVKLSDDTVVVSVFGGCDEGWCTLDSPCFYHCNSHQPKVLYYGVAPAEAALRPHVLASLGPEGRQHFLKAIQKGTMKIARVNIDVLGDGEAGKSSLADSLMNEPFVEKKESTIGAKVIYMTQIATGYVTSWKRDEDRYRFLGTLLARGSVLAQQSTSSKVYLEKAETSTEEVSEVQPLADSQVTEEDSSTVEAWKPSSSSPAEASSAMSQEKKQVVLFGEREFQIAKALTEEQMLAIKSLQDNPDELEKQQNLIHTCVCDRGGQEHYLPIHTALIANCSEFIPKTYLLVFNLMKRLADLAIPAFRTQPGMGQLTNSPSRQLKNSEILGCWATAVDLAHPQSDMEMYGPKATEGQQRPFLGQHHVLRGPPMFIIGTHYDEIVTKGEEGQQLFREQEIAVKKMLSEHKYIKRVVSADTKSNQVIFKVDNTRSGSDSPDPMVNTLKQLIFDMAMAYKNDTSATPLPYVVLELGLLNISQPDGPSSPCDSERKIVAIKDVVQLAQRYCDIEDERQCETALRYLSSVGSIFYFFKATGLTDKIFPDPQWLFDVMSTFVTVLSQNDISLQLWNDLKELKEKGKLSRELAEHLLEKRPELGVKPKHYNTIFCLLQLVDVFCPALAYSKSTIEDAKMFYVPCMLEVDYVEETAWEESDVAKTSHPPSLIFKASNVDSFPESLFFRLSSRTTYQFPEDPQLKRNRILVLFDDCEMELELLYHPSCRYVIATIVPVCNEEPPIPEVIKKHCVYIRRFLCWQLDDAKRNGMDGFQYEMYFQDGKKSGTMTVDETSLFRLPNGDELTKTVINPHTRKRRKTDSLPIKSYYCSTNTEYDKSSTRKKSAECVVTDAQLSMVADVARHKWFQIGVSLGLGRAELSQYEGTKDLHYRLFCLLADWKRKNIYPTVEVIIEGCEKAGVGGEVRRVLQL